MMKSSYERKSVLQLKTFMVLGKQLLFIKGKIDRHKHITIAFDSMKLRAISLVTVFMPSGLYRFINTALMLYSFINF